MHEKKIKLIVSDMDGCLLDGEGRVPAGFGEAVRLMKDKGVMFAAASGRTVEGMRKPFGELSDRISYISDNGARVFLLDKCIVNRILPYEKYIPAIGEMRKHRGLLPVACGTKAAYVEHMDEITPVMKKELSKYYPVLRENGFDNIPDEIIKFALLYFDDIEKNIYPYFGKYDNEDIRVQVTAFVWIDIYEKSVSKGSGIRELQKSLGIGREETVVFGDYLNDLPMADMAFRSFAPSNAHPEVKERFTDIIAPNTEGSVAETIIDLLS
ncbi:MAG: HAD family hydrolase [Lachnospiraceae bacterium]|nr:HAD family hydrolase [Lachnospiraceae bacterium]